jgi:2-polyprenyl-3-methyl-5-hydroxy-6-metoxy-1,4-benzoquinol methylase
MQHTLDTVILSQALPDSADARFGMRLLQSLWSAHTRVVSGMGLEEGLALVPAHSDQDLVLWIDSPWLSPDRHCLARLQAALEAGAEVAWACDSLRPAPMPAAGYATMRGMERFVDEHPAQSVAVADDHVAGLGLATRAGWQKYLSRTARVVQVVGAWAHDASGYFGGERREVLPLLPPHMQTILDVGGGEGGFLAAVKEAHPQVLTQLVELTPGAAAIARTKPGINRVWVGSFFDWQTTDRYDCISFLDVLEHLVDPEHALLHAKSLLSSSGAIVMSLPNVGHWTVVADLLEGRWDWAPAGIHCYTHVRFFTRHTIEAMLQRVGLQIDGWDTVRVPCPPPWKEQWATPGLQLHSESLDVYAYLIRATPIREAE